MKTFYVYCLTDNESIFYVGKGHRDSETGYDRIRHYSTRYRHLHTSPEVLSRIERIESGRNFSARILCDGLGEPEAFDAERSEIKKARAAGFVLVNKTSGGCSGWTLSVESRRKMSLARKGVKQGPRTELAKQHMSEAAKLRATPEWRSAHSTRLTGKELSSAHKSKISEGLSSAKIKGRPKGWTLAKDELEHLRLPVTHGRVDLSEDQKKAVRNYRYSKAF